MLIYHKDGHELHEAKGRRWTDGPVFMRCIHLASANLAGADLGSAYLQGCDFTDASFKDADLSWANLRFANFTGVNFEGAHLEKADLRDARLDGADFSGANLTDADVRYTDFSKTLSSPDTICPDGYKLEKDSLEDRVKSHVRYVKQMLVRNPLYF
jgi:uncharacterized protein YjbI with pentapeptide repeats